MRNGNIALLNNINYSCRELQCLIIAVANVMDLFSTFMRITDLSVNLF